MAHGTSVSIDQAVEQTAAVAVSLSAIRGEIQTVLSEERHAPGLTATVLATHAKRAALVATSLAGLARHTNSSSCAGASSSRKRSASTSEARVSTRRSTVIQFTAAGA